MRKIYKTVDSQKWNLNKVGGVCNSKIEYYKLKDVQYGIAVKETQQAENSKSTEIKEVQNITGNEAKINEILEILVDRKIEPYIAEDIIHDIMARA